MADMSTPFIFRTTSMSTITLRTNLLASCDAGRLIPTSSQEVSKGEIFLHWSLFFDEVGCLPGQYQPVFARCLIARLGRGFYSRRDWGGYWRLNSMQTRFREQIQQKDW